MNDVMTIADFKHEQDAKRLRRLQRICKSYLKRVKEVLGFNEYSYFYVGLTFRDLKTFLESRNEYPIRRYIHRLKQYLSRQGHKIYSYFWVLEMQSRGVPHYHIFLVTDKSAYIPFPDKTYWVYGSSNLQRVSKQKISKNYLSKYLEKQEQKIFLRYCKGMRIYTMYVCKELKEIFRDVIFQTYNFFRYQLAKFFNRFIKKNRGYFVDSFKINLLYRYLFVDGLVMVDFSGVKVQDDDGNWYIYSSYEDFWSAINFVYDVY